MIALQPSNSTIANHPRRTFDPESIDNRPSKCLRSFHSCLDACLRQLLPPRTDGRVGPVDFRTGHGTRMFWHQGTKGRAGFMGAVCVMGPVSSVSLDFVKGTYLVYRTILRSLSLLYPMSKSPHSRGGTSSRAVQHLDLG